MLKYYAAYSCACVAQLAQWKMRQIEMLVWLSWQSSSLVMSRSPVRIRPQAPKRHPGGCLFFAFFLPGMRPSTSDYYL